MTVQRRRFRVRTKYGIIRPDAGCIGTRKPTPEQIEEMPFSARRIKCLTRNVATPIASDLPASPRHRPAILVVSQLLHVTFSNADVVNILRPEFDRVAINRRHIFKHHARDFNVIRRLRGQHGRVCSTHHHAITWTVIHISDCVRRSPSVPTHKPTIVILPDHPRMVTRQQ